LAAGVEQRHGAARLVEQVADLAEVGDTFLAQQRVDVCGRQSGSGQFPALELAASHEYAGWVIDEPDGAAVSAENRDDAMGDQEGDQRDSRRGKRRVRRGRTSANDRADRDSDGEIERAELGNRAPFA